MNGSTNGISRRVPVLIVGGGPVGLGLAVDLGQRGVECLLVEQTDGSIYHPRANAVNSRTMEFCRRWGIAEAVRESGAPPDFPPTVMYATGMQGFEICRIERPTHGGRTALPTTPERPQRCNQLFFDPILKTRAEQFESVTLKHSTKFESFERDGDDIYCTLRNTQTGETETVVTRYLVSCCGGQSAIPKALGISMEGEPALFYNLNVFLKIDRLWERSPLDKAAFYFLVGKEGAYGSVIELDGNELWRFGLTGPQYANPPETIDLKPLIDRAIGPDVPCEVISVRPWICRQLVSRKFSDGPILLAGDAVHQNAPTGGFGMNTGMGDANDLGWKLQALVEGWGGETLLTSYEIERKPVAKRNVDQATENMIESRSSKSMEHVEEAGPEGEAARKALGDMIIADRAKTFISDGIALGYRYAGSPIVVPDGTDEPPFATMTYEPTTWPGARAPHAWVADGKSTLDLYGKGFVLMRFDGAADARPLADAAASRRVPFEVVDVNNPEIATLYERKMVLVRPDGHVAWRGDAPPDDAGKVVDIVRGAA